MSTLSNSIQRSRYMDLKGHNVMVVEKRNIMSDRCDKAIIKKLNTTKSVTEEPKVFSNLYQLFN